MHHGQEMLLFDSQSAATRLTKNENGSMRPPERQVSSPSMSFNDVYIITILSLVFKCLYSVSC